MSEPSLPRQTPGREGRPTEAEVRLADPTWVRPTLMFLLGLLLGTVLIAASRPLASISAQPTDGRAVTNDNQDCLRVVADAQHLAELAGRAADAAQQQDAASLGTLVRELNQTESSLDVDVPGCHR